jgi:hypothetical protein
MWGYVKDKVFVPPLPASFEQLRARIPEAAAAIDADVIIESGTKSLTDGASAA